MLKLCPECCLQVSDKAATCPHCGYPLKSKSSLPPKKKKHMRLPNGFGQIREWVQDKKDKATNWCYAHKNEILTYGPVVVSGIAAGAKMLSKHTAQAKEQDLKDLYVYSHRTGHYIKLRRKLKTSEWAEFDRRKRAGENEYDILADMKVLG